MDDDLLLRSVQSSFTILTDAAALYDAVSAVSVLADELRRAQFALYGQPDPGAL